MSYPAQELPPPDTGIWEINPGSPHRVRNLPQADFGGVISQNAVLAAMGWTLVSHPGDLSDPLCTSGA